MGILTSKAPSCPSGAYGLCFGLTPSGRNSDSSLSGHHGSLLSFFKSVFKLASTFDDALPATFIGESIAGVLL